MSGIISENLDPPRTFCPMTREWIDSLGLSREDFMNHYTECYPQHIIHCPEPRTVESNLFWKFRRDNDHETPAAFVAILDNGRVWGSNGAVITPDNKLLADVSVEINKTAKKHSIFSEEKLPPVEYTDASVAILAADASWNYFHWMFDILPRIDLLCKANVVVDYIVINMSGAPFQEDTLSVLGLPRARVIKTHRQFHLKAKKLVIPSLPGHTGFMPKWACQFLRKIFLKNTDTTPLEKNKRLYVSRARASSRRVRNEAQVIDALSAFGFKEVILDSMSVTEQALLFSTADIIVFPHGAALTNIVFCKPGTKIIEIFSPNYVNVLYWVLSSQMNLDYYYMIGEGRRPDDYKDPHNVGDDISVNIDALVETIKLASS